ncbi:Flagellar hook-basal body complex protein FliE [Rhodovulum sp. PH10]|uniref:flagellar hook-basal body complex protein FliE n=1 Tax=Rhodovulum sp. PH10 TaxID=1187851 RepID=UPI00027C1F61|nr:flagellar hook-basal body complex protein FliE [Rhodovulum sp. PH10]EJW09377.1 Flagellar hook-basal body complex protein FliE [Rhodovulum sp. PH10]
MAIPGVAANAYATAARLGQPSAGLSKTIGDAAIGGAAETGDQSFGSVLSDAIRGVEAVGHASDAQAASMVAGKANMVDVVTAVAETETAVQSLVSVRDKVIQAYEEIMRMTI